MKFDPKNLPQVATLQAELASEHQCLLGEGPLWDEREQALYWVNIPAGEIHRFDPATGKDSLHTLPTKVTSLARRAAGGLVVTLRKNFALFDPKSGSYELLDELDAGLPDNRSNDGKVDRLGRYWAGTMNEVHIGTPNAALYRYDRPGQLTKKVSDVIISNGLGWSPDNKTMYYTDTLRYVIYAYDFDLESGEISNRRNFLELDPASGILPDGMTVDAEGFVWTALINFGCVRLDPAGQLERIVHYPAWRGSCCTFGGANYEDLYITTARECLSEAELAEQPLAGSLFRCRPGVKGLPEPLAKF